MSASIVRCYQETDRKHMRSFKKTSIHKLVKCAKTV